jgi:hypothetical protein
MANAQSLSRRDRYTRLKQDLENERSSFIDHYRDVGDHVLPRRPRFVASDLNQGYKRNGRIIDSTATLAARTLRSGMMSGITSPARPWFRLVTPDPALNDVGSVKEWLYVVSQRMTTVFARSNLYNCLPIVYGDLGVFGTAAMSIEEDFDDVLRFYPFPIGSYAISNNARLQVDTFTRTFRMTVRQLIERFANRSDPEIKAGQPMKPGEIDWANFSPQVRNAWEEGRLETWIDVTHVIEPNRDYDPKKLQSKYKRYKSVYFEWGGGGSGRQSETDPDVLLSEKGYDYFPILCPRWEVTGEDAYGTSCPGMDALGDIRQLQIGEKRIAQAIEKMINPPMVGPTSLKTAPASVIPGGMTYLDLRGDQAGFKPVHEIQPRIQEMAQSQSMIRERIKKCFFEDIFLMMAESDRRTITATEIDERKEEKLLALGPVLEQLNQDLLDPLIDIGFQVMAAQGLIPPPPKEMQGVPLRVEYISVMAQAQKLVGIESMEKFSGFVGQIMQVMPNANAGDNIDIDQLIEVYGEQMSIPPGIVRSSDQIAEVRAERAKQQQAIQAQEASAQAAQTAQTLSQTDTGGGSNALQQLMQASQAGALAPTR